MTNLEKYRSLLHDGVQGLLLTSRYSRMYAAEFDIAEGVAVVSAQGARYFTDSRYIEAARQEVQGAQVELVTRERGHLALAAGYLQERGLKRVGFESGAVSVDALARYERALPCTLVPAQDLPDGLRASKDGEELAAMEKAQRITDEAFQAILNFIRPGQTEREVAARLVYELLRRGGERVSFDPIVAAGANGSKPHAVPGDTVIQPGMFVTMDFGCVWRGYCSDMTRTVAVGKPAPEMERVYQVVLEAQQAGIAAARAGLLHDIGKIVIPPDVLFKEEKLTAVEFEQIQCHVLYGYHILCGSQEPFFQLAANIAREHHERFDGSGYLGLHGREIDRYARMTAVADVFDALTTERTYKKAWSFEDGFLYILDHAGDFFDPEIVQLFEGSREEIEAIYRAENVRKPAVAAEAT